MSVSVRTENSRQDITLRYATDAQAVHNELQRLANQTGRQLKYLTKWAFPQTTVSSVQGRWHPTFTLKSNELQLEPLLQTQTHLIGLAPTLEAQPQPAPIMIPKRAKAARRKTEESAAPVRVVASSQG
jgi:hypothetical protein